MLLVAIWNKLAPSPRSFVFNLVGGGATVNVGEGASKNSHLPGKDSNIVASSDIDPSRDQDIKVKN